LSNNFSRTLRALQADGLTGWAMRALLAALLLSVWASWFFMGHITLWAVSVSAQAEIKNDIFEVDAPVEGTVIRVPITRGQHVEKDDVLVELQAEEQEGEMDALAAELEALIARRNDLQLQIENERAARSLELNAAGSRIDEALAKVREAEAASEFAAGEEARFRDLFERGLISQGDLDRAVSELEQAEAQEASARAAATRAESDRDVQLAERNTGIEALKGQLEVQDNRIRAKRANIGSLQSALGMRLIRAPTSGVLGGLDLPRPGSVVRAGEKIARIVPPGKIRVVARYQPAEALGRISRGQHARLRLDAFPSTQYGTIPVTVARVANEASEGHIRVELDLDEGQPTNIDLEHGMPGRVEVEVDRVSPASLLMRAVGRLLDQPASERSGASSEAGASD
jgi:membrane fusion protein (multidrug efflux system)